MSAIGYGQTDGWAHGFVFTAHRRRQSGVPGLLKRVLDVSVAAAALAVLAAPMLVVAIAIRLDSRGPVMIWQERLGRDGKPFRMYKFRSMVAGAHDLLDGLRGLNEASGPLFKMAKDPRVTRFGRYLRRASFDETPQLINVLKGEMSLVGPRPPFAHEVAHDPIRQSIRLQATPGMTGLWQVSGRSDLPYETMVSLDVRYLEEWTLRRDVKILIQTPAAVLSGRGAR
ncbi:MAG TPA: sugar transferase [Candidatus Dormibacteraeota bacterium]|jgi:lipopolysaccharide/colanic/teichoic acid biosynthesis glycosyltransferase